MPLRLDIKKTFSQRSERVKGVDIHPTEPWILASLYSGHVYIWNYAEQSLVKTFEITELPVRTAKFISRKQWMICGADDMMVRVYNYNTMDKVKQFEAHTDYIRHIAVHPTLPYIITCSDDMFIKLWDWDKGWQCTQIFEGHSHYVMQVVFNPKDTNTFASASLDRTIKVWSLGSPVPNMTLEGHERGVNCIDYYSGGDRPYLLSGADDRTVKVWDYQTKACVHTLEGHAHNVAAAIFHPELPLIVTGSEDGTVKMWHSTTYRLENTLNYGMERVWAISSVKGSNAICIGYDEGCVMVKLGREEPVASMDASGKIIWAKHNEVQTVNVRSLGDMEEVDGERLPLAVKELGSCDVYPQTLQHSPNGRFVTVCGDGEYIVYTALAWRNKAFGAAQEFVWGDDSNVFAIKENNSTVKIHRNFKEALTIKVPFAAEGIYGGRLLGIRSKDFIVFYDWLTGNVVRRIDVGARHVYWSDTGSSVAIAGETAAYILTYDADAVESFLASGEEPDEDGIEDAFDLQAELAESVRTALWVGDCFIYTNSAWRLNYCVGGEVTTLHHLEKPAYLLGYLATQSKVYLMDRDFNIVPYTLLLSVVEYKTLVLRGDLETAADVLENIPKAEHNDIAKFLDAKGMPELALDVATDADYQFELAVQLGRLDQAMSLAASSDSEAKWRQLGELALASGKLPVAEQCFEKAKDLGGLLLLYSSRGDAQGMASLAEMADAQGKLNIAFICKFMLSDVDGCIDLLAGCGRIPEAAFFARTYKPSRTSEIVKLWQADLAKINPKAAESLANPTEYPNLFPNLQEAFAAEAWLAQNRSASLPASRYESMKGANLEDLIVKVQHLGLDGLELPNGNGAGGGGAVEMEEEEDVFAGVSNGAQEPAAAAVEEAQVPSYQPHQEIENPTYENQAEDEEPEEEDPLPVAAPPPPPVVAAEPEPAPSPMLEGLTAEEEALLAEEGLDDENMEFDDADLDLGDEDDWGLDEEEEAEKKD